MKQQVDKIVLLIRDFLSKKKIGSIKVNMYEGGITNLNINESVKLPKEKE